MKNLVNILVISADNELLVRKVDDNSDDNYAGKVVLFGGVVAVRWDETAPYAAVRILKDEAGIEAQLHELKFFGTYYTRYEIHGEEAEVKVYVLAGVDEKLVRERVGAGVQVVEWGADLGKVGFSILAREVAADYFRKTEKV